MAFTTYKSSDASAPVLTGQTGSLLTLFDAVLVNGYGSKAAAGWTKAFSGTNKAAYLQGTGSSGHYFRILDDGSDATLGARGGLVSGYKPMTGIDTGTLMLSQQAIYKSYTADSTARPWVILADAQTCYLFTEPGQSTTYRCAHLFGDIYSFAPTADGERAALIARNISASGATITAEEWFAMFANVGSTITAHYLAGEFGSPGEIAIGKHGDANKSSALTSSLGILATPNPVDSAYYISPIFVHNVSGNIRGRLRGCWQICHPVSGFTDGQEISGANDLIGRTFTAYRRFTQQGTLSERVFLFETSDTLDD